MWLKIVLGLFLTSQVLDGLFTIYLLNTGLGYESNPFMAWLMEKMGLYQALILAKSAACAIGFILYYRSKSRQVIRLGLIYVTVGMLLLDAYSISLIHRIG